nr:stromal cell-derived factor 1 isoform X1 [Pan paniscus]
MGGGCRRGSRASETPATASTRLRARPSPRAPPRPAWLSPLKRPARASHRRTFTLRQPHCPLGVRPPTRARPPARPPARAMNAKVVVVLVLVLTALCLSDGKPVSLSYRCPCRFFESHVARANVKHLKILNTPNCALQIVARLKNNNRQVCIDPKLKWIQEYLEKALNNLISAAPAGKRVIAGARALHPSPPRACPTARALCEIRLWPPPEWSWPSPGDV